MRSRGIATRNPPELGPLARRALLLMLASLPLACAAAPPPPPPMPAGVSWNGGWDTTFGPLVLEQNADEVLGIYKYPNGGHVTTGVLVGRMRGNLLEFTWEEKEGGTAKGKGTFEMRPDGQSFTGRLGYGKSARDGIDWVGMRVK